MAYLAPENRNRKQLEGIKMSSTVRALAAAALAAAAMTIGGGVATAGPIPSIDTEGGGSPMPTTPPPTTTLPEFYIENDTWPEYWLCVAKSKGDVFCMTPK